MKSLLHSRKFWLAGLDMVVIIAILWTNELVPVARAEIIVATIIAIQAPFIVLINGIATEDAARIMAGTHPSQKE